MKGQMEEARLLWTVSQAPLIYHDPSDELEITLRSMSGGEEEEKGLSFLLIKS